MKLGDGLEESAVQITRFGISSKLECSFADIVFLDKIWRESHDLNIPTESGCKDEQTWGSKSAHDNNRNETKQYVTGPRTQRHCDTIRSFGTGRCGELQGLIHVIEVNGLEATYTLEKNEAMTDGWFTTGWS